MGKWLLVMAVVAVAAGYSCDLELNTWRKKPRLKLNEREILAPTAHGVSLVVDARDEMVSSRIFQTGTWEPRLLTLLASLVASARVFLNVGAQTGLEAVVLTREIQLRGGRSFLFEPYSASYRMLAKSIWLNGLQNCSRLFRLAAGDGSRLGSLAVDISNTGHSSLKGEGEVREGVSVVEVDQVVGSEVDLALIDVEGLEVEVLLGMRGVLGRSSGISALVEWNYLGAGRDEGRTGELLDWLEEKGFQWLRYEEGEKCRVGQTIALSKVQLLLINSEDLLLAGPTSPLLHHIS